MNDTENPAPEIAGDNVPDMGIEDALAMFEDYKNYWEEIYREANTDLKMAAGDPETHWGTAYNSRVNDKKLTLVINELPQYIHQVTNDIRQNTPSVKAIPEGDGDIETGEIFGGLIRSIEYKSSADEVYDTAAEYAVKCSIGFMRVDHDYIDDDSDEQELMIKRVVDPLSCWLDPASIECDGRDANGAIFLEPVNKKTFERLYPKKVFSSFTDPKNISADTKDSAVIGEIFVRTWGGKRGKKATIYRYKFSGTECLAKTTFPGDYIPLVPIYGEETWIDGKRKLSSLIRQARDPQLRLNHWACKEQELLNMAPTAPVMAAQGSLVNERGQWQRPGSEMVLEYKRTDINGDACDAPTRLQPPSIPTGIINAMQGAKENIKESMGIYNAGLGKREGDSSGKALESLQKEGDVATFHFPDNVRRSITQIGRILICAVPTVYDTPRIIQIVNEETDPQMVGINGAQLQPGQKQPYDLTKGKYHVRVTTGASFTTKREAAAQMFGDVIKQNPQLMQVIGDLWAKNLDVPGSEAMAARFKKMIPPQLQDDQQEQDPQVAQLQQLVQHGQAAMQELQAQLAQVTQELKSKQAETQAKVQDTQTRAQVDSFKIQVEREKLQLERDKLILLNKQLDIQAREVDLKYPPQNDTGQDILQHHLDEVAADNQLGRDLLHQAATIAMQPESATQNNQQNQAAS